MKKGPRGRWFLTCGILSCGVSVLLGILLVVIGTALLPLGAPSPARIARIFSWLVSDKAQDIRVLYWDADTSSLIFSYSLPLEEGGSVSTEGIVEELTDRLTRKGMRIRSRDGNVIDAVLVVRKKMWNLTEALVTVVAGKNALIVVVGWVAASSEEPMSSIEDSPRGTWYLGSFLPEYQRELAKIRKGSI